METISPSPAFHQYFKQHVGDVQSQIDSLARPDLSAESRKAMTENILTSLTKLSATLADASSDLASYDQRSYNQTIKTLQDQLVASQAIMAPRTKFSFKNKKSTTGNNPASLIKSGQRSHIFAGSPGPASDIDSTATSGSATPVHLQDPEDGDTRTMLPVPMMAPPPLHLSMADRAQNMSESITTELWTSTDPNDQESGIAISSRNNSYFSLESSRQQTTSKSDQVDKVADQEHPSPQLCVVSLISHSIINLKPTISDIGHNLSSLTLTELDSTLLVAPAVDGPAHITSVWNSTLILSCRQFRMHDSRNVTVYLYCTSRPIIENCTGIRFATLPEHLKHVGLPQSKNMFDQVDDFKWLRAKASPNWDLLPKDQQVAHDSWIDVFQIIKKLDGDPDIESSKLAKAVESVLRTLGIEVSN